MGPILSFLFGQDKNQEKKSQIIASPKSWQNLKQMIPDKDQTLLIEERELNRSQFNSWREIFIWR